jgi:hypothetical protein
MKHLTKILLSSFFFFSPPAFAQEILPLIPIKYNNQQYLIQLIDENKDGHYERLEGYRLKYNHQGLAEYPNLDNPDIIGLDKNKDGEFSSEEIIELSHYVPQTSIKNCA